MRALARSFSPQSSLSRRSALRVLTLGVVAVAGGLTASHAGAQSVVTPPSKPGGFFLFRQPQKPVTQAIPAQPGAVIYQTTYETLDPTTSRVVVSLPKQRVYLLTAANDVAIDAPISSGRKGHGTPAGTFRITAKEPEHYSNIYGNYVDKGGRVVRSGISAKIDSAPSGTHFEGAPMRWFMRLTDTGVGMHIGILPGYPASHGCVRLPVDIAPLIYQKVKTGTSVKVEG